MQVGLLATNGGPHSAETWAATTAGQIIQIGANAAGTPAAEARKLELKIIDILEDHHTEVQAHERAAIVEHGDDRLKHAIDPTVHALDDKVAEIVAAAKGTQFEEHFARSDVRVYIKQVLGSHFASSMDIERSWHADRLLRADPLHGIANVYHKLRAKVGAGLVHAHAEHFPEKK